MRSASMTTSIRCEPKSKGFANGDEPRQVIHERREQEHHEEPGRLQHGQGDDDCRDDEHRHQARPVAQPRAEVRHEALAATQFVRDVNRVKGHNRLVGAPTSGRGWRNRRRD